MIVAVATENNGVMFECPGCGCAHRIQHGSGDGPRWAFNGSFEKPTFHPSVLVRGTQPITDDEHKRIMGGEKIEPRPLVCHSFVTDGRIAFLGDCTHGMAGQTVDLPEWD